MAAHKHLTLDDRFTIQKGLDNSSSRKSIADTLGK
ncbi:MAG: helix-turn-helix domain-containing protein, partial [Erysipelotrichaceae bacterium]|nr:helix-turn-helix domain-containing protein [Erysipelotrichaceae bacterium]